MAPQLVDNPATVAAFVREKQALEVQLAYELLEIFNTDQSLIGPIRDRAHAALAAMLTAYEEYRWLRGAIQATYNTAQDEQNRMARSLNANNPPLDKFPALRCGTLDQMMINAVNFDLQDCCWVIRMYGEFVERLAKVPCPAGPAAVPPGPAAPAPPPPPGPAAAAAAAAAAGPGPAAAAAAPPPPPPPPGPAAAAAAAAAAGPGPAAAAAAPVAPAPDPRNANIRVLNMLADQIKLQYRRGFQWKSDVQWFPVAPAGELRGRDDELAAGLGGTAGFTHNFLERTRTTAATAVPWLIDTLSEPYQFVNSLRGGISIFRPTTTDTTLKIDRVFGLLPGATISGTTTDLMYFMDTFASGDRDPIYYLAAVAGIVSQGHHTILEVALPLALNGWVDYSIGYYTSLMPTGHRPGRAATMHPAQGAIWDALDKAERDSQNRLMLVYYKAPDQFAGCYLFDGIEDRLRFKLLATADDNLVRTFDTRFPNQWATHEQVWNWFHLYYPQ